MIPKYIADNDTRPKLFHEYTNRNKTNDAIMFARVPERIKAVKEIAVKTNDENDGLLLNTQTSWANKKSSIGDATKYM